MAALAPGPTAPESAICSEGREHRTVSQNARRGRRARIAPKAGSRAKAANNGLQPEFELDAVGVLERHEPPEVDHAHRGVGHAELVEMGDPAVELTLVGDLEGEVIEARAAVVEGAGRAGLGLA